MNNPAIQTGSRYGDCRDWLRIDLDRKMPSHRGGKRYAPDLVRASRLYEQYGITQAMLEQAAKLGIIKPGRKHRASDKYFNLYDGNEVALRILEIEKLRGKA